MKASDDLVAPWYRSVKGLMREIEKEIQELESDTAI